MTRRRRVAFMVRLIGYGMWSVCSKNQQITSIMTEIQTKPTFVEFGNPDMILTAGFRKDLTSFRRAVEAGVAKEHLLMLFPTVCKRYPGFANSHMREIKLRDRSKSETSESSGGSDSDNKRFKKIEDSVKKHGTRRIFANMTL